MAFTVVFRANNKYQVTYELTFEPHPIWKSGEDWALELNPEKPVYEEGSVRRLLEREVYLEEVLHEKRACIIICEKDELDHRFLKLLEKDLAHEGFNVSICSFNRAKSE